MDTKEQPEYMTDRLSAKENATLKELRASQEKIPAFREARLQAAAEKKKPALERRALLHEWVRKVIDTEYARRMAMPEAEQEKNNLHFNSNPRPLDQHVEFLPFDKGVAAYKDIACIEYHDSDRRPKDVTHGLGYYHERTGGFKQRDIQDASAKAKARYANATPEDKAQMDLLSAYVEAQTGFYRLTKEQYDALSKQTADWHMPREYSKIQDSRPPLDCFKKTTLAEFNVIVAEVHKELGLPVNMPHQGLALTRYDHHVENLIKQTMDYMDNLPKPVPKIYEALHIGRATSPYGKLGAELEQFKATIDPANKEQQEAFEKVVKAYNAIRPQQDKGVGS